MGLAAAKNRRKLAKDPNNTKWSRNTASFGQKILRSQGWEPGQYLGAVDAPHAEFHTAANASHVRAAFQEGNLGIGAKRNRGDECTGLDAFQDLLGRLNGKSEQALETDRQHRSDVKLSLYIERRFGTIRFVRGGLLVGDQVKEEEIKEIKREEEEENAPGILTPAESSEEAEDKRRRRGEKSKKRKAEQVDDQEDSDSDSDAHRKEKKRLKKEKKEKKTKLKDRETKKTGTVSETAGAADSSEAEASPEDKSSEKGKSKKDKKREDEEDSEEAKRAAKKEKKRKKRRKEAGEGEASAAAAAAVSSTAIPPAQTGLSSPAGSGTSTPVSSATRHLARKRFIAQKRMATMDPQALNQIFMIKS